MTQIQKGCDPANPPTSGSGVCHWETTTIAYTPFEAIDTLTLPSGRGVKYHYDTAHRLTQIDELDSQGQILGSKILTLTESGKVSNINYKNTSGSSVEVKSFDYDNLNQLKSVIDSNNKVFGQTYDANGNLQSNTDPLNHSQIRLYDALNRLTQTTLPDANKESVSYGSDNTVASQTDANNNATTYQYDGEGYVTDKYSPDSGHSHYQYDFNHNLIYEFNSAGRATNTTFDVLNRPISRTVNSGETRTWTYDSCQNGLGRLCSISDLTGVTTFEYDRFGHVTQKQEALNGMNGVVTLTLSYSYDNYGELTGMTYPSGGVVNQTWTNDDITHLSWNGVDLAGTIRYDPWHKILGWTWPSGRNVSFSYDLDGRVSQTQYGLTTRTLSRDDAWRLDNITQTNPALSFNYGYDSRDRLLTSDNGGTYTYDNNSNRLSWLGSLGPVSYTLATGGNGLSQYAGNTVAMDSRGFLLQIKGPGIGGTGMTINYDDWDRVRTIDYSTNIITYGVNGLGERVSKSLANFRTPNAPFSQNFYMYDHIGHLMGIYDQNGQVLEEFIYNNERPMVDVRNKGATLYNIETEANRTPIRVLDASNNTVWSWENHDPFGYSDPTEGFVNGLAFKFDLRFPGQYFDEETGLVQNGFRDYSPLLGRYLEIDPMGLNAGMNPYGYVGGNPVDNVDPSGLVLTPHDERGIFSNDFSQYNQALGWLRMNSPVANALITKLIDSPINYDINIVSPFKLFGFGSENTTHTILHNHSETIRSVDWNPVEGVLDVCKKGTPMYINPAMALLHELEHLDSDSTNSELRHSKFDKNYDNAEEKRVIEGGEAQVYDQIYHSDMVRADHHGEDVRAIDGVTGSHFEAFK